MGPLHVRNISHESQQFLKLKILATGRFVCVGYIVNIGQPLSETIRKEKSEKQTEKAASR